MGIITSVGILILVVLIQNFLQVVPSVFMVFYHYALGKKSKRVAESLSVYFAMGVMFITFLWLSLIYFVIFDLTVLRWILIGILFALSVNSFCFYFKKGKHTLTYLPRRTALALMSQSKACKKPFDAFMLGMMAVLSEWLFLLPPYIVVALEAGTFVNNIDRACILMMFVLTAILPLLIKKIYYRYGLNLAEIQRRRVKNKNFYRIMLSLCYMALAVVLICFRTLK